MTDKHSAPAFSMGGPATHNKLPGNHFVPGPGAYDSASTLQISKPQISKNLGERFKQQVSQVPGPGSYNYRSVNSHSPAAIVVSRAKEYESSSQQAPGPGSYDPNYRNVVKGQGGFKIGLSAKIADIVGEAKKNPGPANYETNKSTLIKDHSVTMGTQKRGDMVLNNFTPGPGQYQDKNLQEITIRNSTKIVFGKAGRSNSTNNLIPGPGSYAIPDRYQQTITKSKGFSMSSKHNQIPAFTTKVPGPGAYNSNQWEHVKHKTSSYSIGKAEKLRVENEKELLTLPGPEKYNITKGAFEHRSVVFGKEKKSSNSKQSSLPGPGTYESKNQTQLPQFSVPKSNTSWVKSSFTPGPGAYEAKNIDSSNYNTLKIKQDERRPFYDEKKWVPGPGSYNSNENVNRAISFKIGTEKRGDMKGSNNPGPGNYTIPSTVANVPKYSH